MNEEGCSICLESLDSGEVVKQLACSHSFHLNCLQKLHGDQCPMCKQPIKEDSQLDLTLMRKRQREDVESANEEMLFDPTVVVIGSPDYVEIAMKVYKLGKHFIDNNKYTREALRIAVKLCHRSFHNKKDKMPHINREHEDYAKLLKWFSDRANINNDELHREAHLTFNLSCEHLSQLQTDSNRLLLVTGIRKLFEINLII